MNKLITIFLVLTAFYSQAQDNSYDKDVKHFIEINGTMLQYQNAVVEFNKMIKEKYKDSHVKEADWKEVKEVAENSLINLLDDLVVVYKKFFTHEEIKALNKLYEQEVAQKFIHNVVSITEASQDASIVWSRSLYNKINDLLHEKGY